MYYNPDLYSPFTMMFRLAIALSLARIGTASQVENTWQKAEAVLTQVKEKMSHVQEHAQEVAAELTTRKEEELQKLNESEAALKKTEASAAQGEMQAEEEAAAVEKERDELESSFLQTGIDSSFLEIPPALAKFPKVSEDMKALHQAEEVYNEKMRILHQKDEELLAMANKDFSDSHQAVAMMGHLRSQQTKRKPVSSFVQKDEMPEAFKRILKAEEDLKAVAAGIARDFHLA
jgi:hypothetical protein